MIWNENVEQEKHYNILIRTLACIVEAILNNFIILKQYRPVNNITEFFFCYEDIYSVYRKSEIEYYALLAKTGVHHYSGNNIELGTACGKYYRVCTLAITDPGDSDIITTLPEATA